MGREQDTSALAAAQVLEAHAPKRHNLFPWTQNAAAACLPRAPLPAEPPGPSDHAAMPCKETYEEPCTTAAWTILTLFDGDSSFASAAGWKAAQQTTGPQWDLPGWSQSWIWSGTEHSSVTGHCHWGVKGTWTGPQAVAL